jgi:hypothetical protein
MKLYRTIIVFLLLILVVDDIRILKHDKINNQIVETYEMFVTQQIELNKQFLAYMDKNQHISIEKQNDERYVLKGDFEQYIHENSERIKANKIWQDNAIANFEKFQEVIEEDKESQSN